MKKAVLSFIFFIFVTLFIGITNSTFADNVNVNLISNPSAETLKTSIPSDWFRLKVGKNNSFFSSKNVGQDASKSLGLNVANYKSGLSGWAFKPVEIKPNIKYNYSEYYKSTVDSYVFLFYIDSKNKVTRVNLGKVSSSTDWKKLDYELLSPKDAKKLTILHFVKSKGELVTDNYSLSDAKFIIKKEEPKKDITSTGSLNITSTGTSDCTYLSISQKVGSFYDASFACEGNLSVKTYKIEILNSLGKVVNTINTKKGDYKFKTEGSYTARCLVDGKTTTPSICQKGIIIKAPTISGGGGGGGASKPVPVSPVCTNLAAITGSGSNSLISNFSCTGNASTNIFKIDILDASGSLLKTVNSNNSTYEFATAGVYTAKCYVNGQTTTVNACQKTISVSAPPPAPTCNELTANIYSGINPLTSEFSCNGNNTTTSYKIDILDGSGSVVKTINNQTGSYLFNTSGNYKAKCYVNNQTTTPLSCEKTISVNTPPPTPECTGLTASPDFGLNTLTSTLNCSGNGTATSYKIDIFNNLGTKIDSISSQSGTYLFNTPGIYTAKCFVNDQTTTPSICEKTVTINEPTPPPPPPVVDNIIPNSSLETVSSINPLLPQSWNNTKIGENDAQFTYLDTGFTGNKSLQIKITSHTGGLAFNYFDKQVVVAGADYDFSVYYKSDVTVQTDIEVTTASGTVYNYVGTMPSSTNWTKYTTSIKMPSNAISATLYTILSSTGTLVTDDYSLSKQPPSELNKAIITLTFDDYFSQSFYDTAYQSFKNHGMAGTMYLVSDYMDQYFPGQMSKSKLIEMRDYGIEIGSHSVTHAHLPLLTQSQIDTELLNSKNIIEQFLGTGSIVDTFASPYGEISDLTISRIKNVYQSHRITEEGFNTKHNFDKYLIKAINPVVTTTPEDILKWVDEAIAKKARLVIVYHDIVVGGDIYSNSPEHLEAVLTGLESRRTAGLLDVKTNKDALADVLSQIK